MSRFKQYLNEDKKTDYLETAQCIGCVISSQTANNIDKFLESTEGEESIKSDIKNILDKNYDWNSRGKTEVKKALNKNEDFIEVLSLIKGMYNFKDDIVSTEISNPQFIHNLIDDYYKVEKEVFGELKGAKANTADCVVTNTSPKDLFDAMRNSTHTVDDSGGLIKFDNGVKYYQISLKKSKEGAQLGKVTKKLKSMGYDVSATEGLNEAKILDKIKKISKSVWSKTSKLISNITKPLIKRIKKRFSSGITDKDLQEISKFVNEKKLDAKTQDLVNEILKNPNELVSKINLLIDSISSKRSNDIYVDFDKIGNIKQTKDKNVAFKLVSNYKTVKLINDLIDDVDSLGNSVKSLISDMLFGGTKLPLWKVYGDFGSGMSYEYLGTIERFISQDMPTGVEVFGVKIKPSREGSFYTITLTMLEKIDSKGKHYIVFRTGTNSSSRFTFIVEGTKEKVIDHNNKLESFL